MNSLNRQPAPDGDRQTWAPWWWYLIAIVPANLIRTALMPDDAPIAAVVAVFAIVTVCVVAAVTALFRATHQDRGEGR